jgi:hypothetical protein
MRQLLDRARDERFRLLKLLREARGGIESPPRVSVVWKGPDHEASAVEAGQKTDLGEPIERARVRLDTTREQAEACAEALARQTEAAELMRSGLAELLTQADQRPQQMVGRLERWDAYLEASLDQARADWTRNFEEERRRSMAALRESLAEAEDSVVQQVVDRFDALAESMQQRLDAGLESTRRSAWDGVAQVRQQVVEAIARAQETQALFQIEIEKRFDEQRGALEAMTRDAEVRLRSRAGEWEKKLAVVAEQMQRDAAGLLKGERVEADASGRAVPGQRPADASSPPLELGGGNDDNGEADQRPGRRAA